MDKPNAVFWNHFELDGPGPIAASYQHQTDYSRVRGAQESRKQAYENVEKLLPFYNKDFIVHTANQIAEDDKLNKSSLARCGSDERWDTDNGCQ